MFVAALAVLWVAAGPREITKADEHRYITVAREFAVGGEWLVCRLNGVTYTHKPPGWFWFAAIANVLGAPWAVAAKVPATVAAAGATALLFDLAWRLHGRVAAWTAAAVLLTAKEYLMICTRGQLDPLVSFWTTLATYCFCRAVLLDPTPRGRTVWTAVGFLAAGGGMLVKGPVAFAIPGAAALVALLWDDRWRDVAWWRWSLAILVLVVPPSDYGLGAPADASAAARTAWSVGLAVWRIGGFVVISGFARSRWTNLRTWRWALAPLALLPGALWAIAAAQRAPEGWGYIRALALGQGVAHAAGQVDKLEPWWFFLKTFPLDLLPWTVFIPAAIWAWRNPVAPERRDADLPARSRRDADRFAMAWLVAPLVVMSMSLGKRDLYLVPVYPAAALLIGRLATTLAADDGCVRRPVVARGLGAFGAIAVIVGALLAAVGASTLASADAWVASVWDEWGTADDRLSAGFAPTAAALGIALVVGGVFVLRARTFPAVARSVGACVGVLALATGILYAPLTTALGSPRVFLETVKARIGDAYLGDYGGGDFACNWICDRTVVPRLDVRADGLPTTHPEVRRVAAAVLANTPGRVYLLVDREHLKKRGLPDGATILLVEDREVETGLLLIGRE